MSLIHSLPENYDRSSPPPFNSESIQIAVFDQNARPSFDVSMIKRSSGVTLDIEHHANAKFRKRKEVKKRRVKKEI